jgi:hypothetical protein
MWYITLDAANRAFLVRSFDVRFVGYNVGCSGQTENGH